MFLAGILHDLGILVIYQQDATLAGVITRHMDENHQLRDQAEREVLGFDHAEVGALLIRAWGLSDELADFARCHHQYQLAQQNPRATLMLALANIMAEDDPVLDYDSNILLASMADQLDLNAERLAQVLEAGEVQCAEVKNIILG